MSVFPSHSSLFIASMHLSIDFLLQLIVEINQLNNLFRHPPQSKARVLIFILTFTLTPTICIERYKCRMWYSIPSLCSLHYVRKSYIEKIVGWFFRRFAWTNDVNLTGEIGTLGYLIAIIECIWGCDKPAVTYFEAGCFTRDGKREVSLWFSWLCVFLNIIAIEFGLSSATMAFSS